MRRLPLRVLLSLALLAGIFAGRAAAAEVVSTLADQMSVAVTIYNEDLALVKDRRQVVLEPGEATLAIREVSARMRPETALFRGVDLAGGLTVLEQNFDFDLLTPEKLLEKYVGREVGVVRTHPATGQETREEATVLSANNGVVLRMGDRIETGVPGRLVFDKVPATLRDRPTLVMSLANDGGGSREVELSYLTGGLGWQADYVAELNREETALDLNGWVTLTNTSGTSYNDASLQLVAGDVHRVREEMDRGRRFKATEMMAAAAPAMAEEELFEYHLYTLARPTTIKENQTKQVALLQGAGVECGKEYRLDGQQYYYQSRQGDLGRKLKVGVFLLFDNERDKGLGVPLPRGVVRVYQRDSRGRVQFVGEDRIDHTPEGETVRLRLGDSFDVTASRTQTDFEKIAGVSQASFVLESGYRIELKNGRDEEVTVKVVEPLPGDWRILEESSRHEKESATTAVWLIPVPAKGEAVLTYRVRVRY